MFGDPILLRLRWASAARGARAFRSGIVAHRLWPGPTCAVVDSKISVIGGRWSGKDPPDQLQWGHGNDQPGLCHYPQVVGG
jgi:hypothetical protein